MTKSVRIENACTSDFKLEVLVEDRQPDGSWKLLTNADGTPIKAGELDYPTAMLNTTIWDSRRLIVQEYKKA